MIHSIIAVHAAKHVRDMLEILDPFEKAADCGQHVKSITTSFITAQSKALIEHIAVHKNIELSRLVACLDICFKLHWYLDANQ